MMLISMFMHLCTNSFTKYISNGARMQQEFLLITDAKLGWKLDHKGFALSVILLILQFDELNLILIC